MIEAWIKPFTLQVAGFIEGIAALIIAWAVLEAVWRLAMAAMRRFRSHHVDPGHEGLEHVRLGLGRWLALALEFLLGADILSTAVAPSWNEIGELAAIAAIRTALNFFLQREIDSAARRRGEARAQVEG
jgi:uncharacterized membrane protein